MKYELDPEAVGDLQEQVEKSEKPKDSDNDPVEQTVEVPKGGSDEEAAQFVQKQYKDKSGLDMDARTADDIAQEARKNTSEGDQ